MNKKSFVFVVILSLLLAVNVYATTRDVCFSFASDQFYSKEPGYGPVFHGSVQDGKNLVIGKGMVTLVVDVNGKENPGGTVTFHSKFYFKGYATHYDMIALLGGGYAYHWKLSGYFNIEATSSPLPVAPLILATKFENALLTAYSPDNGKIGPTLTIQASEMTKGVTMQPGEILKCMGIKSLGKMENFAFTITNKMKPVTSISKSGFFGEKWTAEGSFSASAIRD